jgi:hypothetical protein
MNYGHHRLEGGQAYIQPREKNPVIEAGINGTIAVATTLGIHGLYEHLTKQNGAGSLTQAVSDTFQSRGIKDNTFKLLNKPDTSKIGKQAQNAFEGVKGVAGKIANSTKALWQHSSGAGKNALILAGIIGGVSAVSAFFGTIQNNKPVPIDFKRM